jgi:hypothetical protein
LRPMHKLYPLEALKAPYSMNMYLYKMSYLRELTYLMNMPILC